MKACTAVACEAPLCLSQTPNGEACYRSPAFCQLCGEPSATVEDPEATGLHQECIDLEYFLAEQEERTPRL